MIGRTPLHSIHGPPTSSETICVLPWGFLPSTGLLASVSTSFLPWSRKGSFPGRGFVPWVQELNAGLHSLSWSRILDAKGPPRREAKQLRFQGTGGLTWFGTRLATVGETVTGVWTGVWTMEYFYRDVLMRRLTFEVVAR